MTSGSQPVTIVVATFNRAEYLRRLLASIGQLEPAPAGVVVVDNASTDSTGEVLQTAAESLNVPLTVHRLPVNAGGSGGFSAGVERAIADGATWLWLMDDDVEVLPDALASFAPWLARYRCLHGRRLDHTGEPFFWQHRFNEFLGVHFPVPGNVFANSPVFQTNVACFEGVLLHADVVRTVGLPDPRFFINGDDTTYGWLISRQEPVVYIDRFVLRKARPQKQIDLGVRHLNDSSNLGRYCGMRNRGHLARYLKEHGRFNRLGFALGTVLTAGKELLRLVAVERTLSGVGSLWNGWRESRRILDDPDWAPMPALAPHESDAQ
ncbi:glycosyltransferase [Arthrobacter sp. JZ12]|uniref:glycosyltransferase n=1 Tax=Arthrobacter sp. JZ12 TaxID=2654190 RepID=UPI002B45EFD3|nr:glycosyltransferase [Arthrobacter sp. JZ12]WRH25256.1 glycosyltransferase [Arthrobacter sp. JZ12]